MFSGIICIRIAQYNPVSKPGNLYYRPTVGRQCVKPFKQFVSLTNLEFQFIIPRLGTFKKPKIGKFKTQDSPV